MMELNINLQDHGHLYEQIYDFIKNEIIKGKLLCDERLPSTRSLAEFLSVSRTTVEMAYDQLTSEGYIEARPHRGYYICDIGSFLESAVVSRKTTYSTAKPVVFQTSQVSHKDIPLDKKSEIDFSPRAIDLSEFPYATWKKITREILVDARSDMFSQGPSQGDLSLREIIARYLQLSRGVRCSADQIIVGAGNDYLLMLLEQIIGHRNVAMELFSYKRACEIFERFSYDIAVTGMDESGMLTQDLLKSSANMVYVMPAHQYPTGIVMPIARRMELLSWAKAKPDRYIIEDDYDSEFRYHGKSIPSLQASDPAGRVIYVGTFSKSIAPSIRVSYMVLPRSLEKAYRAKCSCFSSTVSRMNQATLEEFIGNGYFERHLNKMRRKYKLKMELLVKELSPLQRYFGIYGSDAGLHILLSANEAFSEILKKKKITEADFIEKIGTRGVRVYGLSEYKLQRDGRKLILPSFLEREAIIMGFAALSDKEIIEGASKIIEEVKNILAT